MPVYEYRCDVCGHRFSRLFRSVSAANGEAVDCPSCGKGPAPRAISQFAMHLSLESQIDAIDPRIEKELDWADRHHRADDPMDRVNMNFDPPDD